MRRLFLLTLLLAAVLLSSPARLAAQQPEQSLSVPAFEFHSGFWVNLHHFLYLQGRLRMDADAPAQPRGTFAQIASLAELTPAEQKAWNSSVDAYAMDWSSRDLLNLDMALINNRLGELEDCKGPLQEKGPPVCISGLQPKMIAALNQAAPIYRAHWWPQQDRENRAWIETTAPLVRQMGEIVGDELIEVYQRRWPEGVLRVDVSWYAGPQGSYTSFLPLHVTISSHDQRNQGLTGFEVLFHAASHSLAEGVGTAIAAECRKQGKPIPRELWEALVYYTTGELVRRAISNMGSQNASYVPYAYRNGLFEHGWNEYQQVLMLYWQPYLEGKITLDAAISRMVSTL